MNYNVKVRVFCAHLVLRTNVDQVDVISDNVERFFGNLIGPPNCMNYYCH